MTTYKPTTQILLSNLMKLESRFSLETMIHISTPPPYIGTVLMAPINVYIMGASLNVLKIIGAGNPD
jgi:hypothetical protein